MLVTNIHQAKTNLSKLLEEVGKGKEVIIAKAGKPVAKLVMYKEDMRIRKPGLLKGLITVSEDFTKEDDAIQEMFEGSKTFTE